MILLFGYGVFPTGRLQSSTKASNVLKPSEWSQIKEPSSARRRDAARDLDPAGPHPVLGPRRSDNPGPELFEQSSLNIPETACSCGMCCKPGFVTRIPEVFPPKPQASPHHSRARESATWPEAIANATMGAVGCGILTKRGIGFFFIDCCEDSLGVGVKGLGSRLTSGGVAQLGLGTSNTNARDRVWA